MAEPMRPFWARSATKAVVEGVEYPAEPGVTIFVGRNRRHMFINTSEDRELHWLWFIQPNGLEHFFEEIGRPMQLGEAAPEPFARPENVLEIEQRTAFVLRMENGLGLEEIAEVTGAGQETVKSRLRYAFAKIRARFAE